ncbi:MAG: type II secretion system F family protein [Ancrocorticia sp.]
MSISLMNVVSVADSLMALNVSLGTLSSLSPLSTFSPAGLLVGAGVGIGLFAFLSFILRPRPSLVHRVIPYTEEGWIPARPPVVRRVVAWLMDLMETLGSSTSSVRRRLNMLGNRTVRSFRLQQLQWAGAGFMVGVLMALSLAMRGANLLVCLLIAIGSAGAGALAADSQLTRQVRRHSEDLTQQLPDIAELLALAVSSGESIRAALERVAELGNGALVKEIERTLASVWSGTSLTQALAAMSERSGSMEVARFCDALVSSMERGTALSDVLQAQAQDAREQARRQLMEAGGRKEIAMMIPVVFLILPVTILFTLYPGLRALTMLP